MDSNESEIVANSDFSLEIRLAVPSDLETLVEHNIHLAVETEDKPLNRETVTKGVTALLSDPTKGRYFVAVSEGAIIGQLMHTYEWSDWRNGNIWWLQSVYISQTHRRRGVFRQLFEHLWKEAERDPDVVGVRLYVEVENLAAQETYRNMGLCQPGYFVMERLPTGW